MKIIKKRNEEVNIEQAHGGSGSRKLFLADGELTNVQGMTCGFLPINSKFALHSHEGMNEIMYVLKGTGTVKDVDGIYNYRPGDMFIFPSGIEHEIENTSDIENEYIFIRIYE